MHKYKIEIHAPKRGLRIVEVHAKDVHELRSWCSVLLEHKTVVYLIEADGKCVDEQIIPY